MKSLKGRFIKTTILMATISTALVILITLLLLFVFSAYEPYGFQRILFSIEDMVLGSFGGDRSWVIYLIAWAALSIGTVLATYITLSLRLSKHILATIKQLQKAAGDIAAGNLSFDVLACEERELNDLCTEFDKIRKKLKANAEWEKEKKEERNMLMANLSHDMRTPITSIKGYLEGIKDGVANTPEKMDKYLDTIYSKAIVLQKLVDNMAEYAELELGRMQYAFEFIDLAGFLQELAEGYGAEVREQGLAFSSSVGQGPLIVMADRGKLKRVFDNLISNAIKYNQEMGTIFLRAEKEENGVLITLSDTGKGIKEIDIQKVFDGFYRGDAARSNIKGNGLGLGISRQIVESHHGKIWIKSEEGVGTDVYIYLPLRKEVQ